MTEENKTTAEETAEEVKETEAAEDEVTEATPETQAGSEEVEETKENIVVEEFQKGYMYKDSVVRHSMVKVAN